MPFDESMHLLSADPSASPSMSTDDHSSGGPAPDPAAVFQTSILDQVTTRRAVWVALLLALGNMADAVQIMSVGFILAEMDEIPRIQKGKYYNFYVSV